MDTQIKTLWLADLESGLIPQGQGRLGYKQERCFLGVLCDIAVREGVLTKHQEGDEIWIYASEDEEFLYGLPPEVRDWAGIPLDETVYDLIEINDSSAFDFTEVAKLIRERL
jgi:hypothetical protein